MKIKVALTTLMAVVVMWSCKNEQAGTEEFKQEFADISVDGEFPSH